MPMGTPTCASSLCLAQRTAPPQALTPGTRLLKVQQSAHCRSRAHMSVDGLTSVRMLGSGTKFQTWAWSIIHGDETLVPRSVICPTCTSAAQPGCDGFGSVLDACNVCGGDGNSCAGSLPTPPEEVVCPNGDSVSFIQRQGNGQRCMLTSLQGGLTCWVCPVEQAHVAAQSRKVFGMAAQLGTRTASLSCMCAAWRRAARPRMSST